MIEINDKNYNKEIRDTEEPVLIIFYGEFCGPCKILHEMVKDVILPHAENKDVKIVFCDASKNKKIQEKFQVRSVPLTIGVTGDKEFKYPEVGLKSIDKYIGIINKLSRKKTIKKKFSFFGV